jgi:hypothetical protein
MYEKKRLKERKKADAIPLKKDEEEEKSNLVVEAKSLLVPKSQSSKTKALTDYEKNKLFNSQSQIELPTCSTAGSLSSRSGGRNLYGYKCYLSPTKIKSPKKRYSENGSKKPTKIAEKGKDAGYLS